MTKVMTVRGLVCRHNKNSITVFDSYKLDNTEVLGFCKELWLRLPIKYKRSVYSWEKEIIAHNILFNHNILPLHCIDTDLDENEKLHRLIGYEIIYFFWKLTQPKHSKE